MVNPYLGGYHALKITGYFMSSPQPISEPNRIESLDVFRGFALLGILLLNIIGFGLLSPSYSNPGFDLSHSGFANILSWATVDLLAEGAMRCLFSILFGAGVVLFTTGPSGRSAWTHYRRTFWLLMFGLFNAFILLWPGDILVTYALAGAVLYLVREKSVRALLIAAGVLILLMSLLHVAMGFGLGVSKQAYDRVTASNVAGATLEISDQDRELAQVWEEFSADVDFLETDAEAELIDRRSSYASAFQWTVSQNSELYSFVIPVFLFWDALAMMILGMALYKAGVLQAQRSRRFYLNLMVAGFASGLLINGYEISEAYQNDFHLLSTFPQLQVTYHLGRLGMALGYIGMLGLVCQAGLFSGLTARLAAVGRMALTNYLMHSLICAILFTGMGFGLLGQFSRSELYAIVLLIWLLQLGLSPMWLKHYRFGPIEWLWRAFTYGRWPEMRRSV